MTTTFSAPRMRQLRLSPTLSGYIARLYALWLLSFFFGLVGVILLVSMIDLLDSLANKDVALGIVLEMALLKLPYLSQEVMPFTVFFAALGSFWRLTRSNELIVARASGVSIWQVLASVLGVAITAGIVTVTVLNPLASILLGRFEQLEAQYIHHQKSSLSVSSNGLWLRQADAGGQSVFHAQRVTHATMTLHRVIVFRFADQDRFVGRIDAAQAELRPGTWRLFQAWQSEPGKQARFAKEIDIPTDLTREKILDSFAPPETISFWSLPGFIELLEKAGFSAVRHKLQLYRLLAMPVLFAAMILLAAAFSLRPQRRGRIGLVLMGGVLTCFLLYFISNFVFALGMSGKIPVMLSAWTPAGISLMLGIATLLHLEDG